MAETAQGQVVGVSRDLTELVGNLNQYLQHEGDTGGFRLRSDLRLIDFLSMWYLHNKVCRKYNPL